MMAEKVPLRRRVFHAAYLLVVNVIVWVLIPSVVSSALGGILKTLPLASLTFIYEFGALITGLQVLGALTEGRAVSAVFSSGSFVAAAYYIWAAGGGGTLSFPVSGLTLTLDFKTLLFLLVLPSLVGAIRAPLTFLLDQSEAGQPARDFP
jgi:hypothetical protein